MLIDYLVGAALAISGMLALLVFGTDIIRMNTEARENWQAQNALADLRGADQSTRVMTLPQGAFVRGVIQRGSRPGVNRPKFSRYLMPACT